MKRAGLVGTSCVLDEVDVPKLLAATDCARNDAVLEGWDGEGAATERA